MKWETWRRKYKQIVKRLNLETEMDRLASKKLGELLVRVPIKELRDRIQGTECIVFGAGPSLEKDLSKLSERNLLGKTLISADGATSALLDYRVPDVIVTDLDGKVTDQLKAWERCSWMVVHGHGDNLDRIKEYVPKLDKKVTGTVQVEEYGHLHNFGGFTDGDRAAFMAHQLGASKIYLAGMDLGTEIGRYSQTEDTEKKITKLKICGELLTWLSDRFGANIVDLTSEGTKIHAVPHINIDKV